MRPECIAEIAAAIGRTPTRRELEKVQGDVLTQMRQLARTEPTWSQLSGQQRLQLAGERATADAIAAADKAAQRRASNLLAQTREVQRQAERAAAIGGKQAYHAATFERLRQADDYVAGVRNEYPFNFEPADDGLYVFLGIHKGTRVLVEGTDYRVVRNEVVFDEPPSGVLDICAGNAWPERFTREELAIRRKETRTLNAWDSQYQLEAKPLEEVRLDPERITPYDCEIEVRKANNTVSLWLGDAKMVAVSLRWDPSSGKLKSDKSGVALIFQDAGGRRYWHRAEAITGEVAEFDASGEKIIGGQVWQLCDLVEKFQVPRITVETNGIGKFAPSVLKAALKQRRLQCGVTEVDSTENKNKRILEAFEPLLLSPGMLWAHVDVLDGEVWDEMKDWNAAVKEQPDDLLDAGAGAITDTPERVGKLVGNSDVRERQDWRPSAGVYEVEVDH